MLTRSSQSSSTLFCLSLCLTLSLSVSAAGDVKKYFPNRNGERLLGPVGREGILRWTERRLRRMSKRLPPADFAKVEVRPYFTYSTPPEAALPWGRSHARRADPGHG